jgi:hypothetical protein
MNGAKNLASIPKFQIRANQMLRCAPHENCWKKYGTKGGKSRVEF